MGVYMELFEELNEEIKTVYGIDIISIIDQALEELRNTIHIYAENIASEEGIERLSETVPEHASIISSSIMMGLMNLALLRSRKEYEDIIREMFMVAKRDFDENRVGAGAVSLMTALGAKLGLMVVKNIGDDEDGWTVALFACKIAGLYSGYQLKNIVASWKNQTMNG